MATDDEFARALQEELNRRIAEFAQYDERTFGSVLSTAEVAAALFGCAVIPIFIVWVFA